MRSRGGGPSSDHQPDARWVSLLQEANESGLAWRLLIIGAALALLYVALALTPSHYAAGLQRLGVDARPLLFLARGVRSDEWIALTPLFQTAVRGGFETYNQISPYHESLKGFWALPILDWSLVFKPQLWGFWLLPPAFAFSLYFALLWISFLAGYTIMLVQLGARLSIAALGSICLLFSSFVQVWWTSNAPAFALAPWPLVVFLLPLHPLLKLPLLFWSSAVWIFGFAYPPFIIPTAFVLGVLVLAFRRDSLTFANVVVAVAAMLGLGFCFLWYFGDLLQIMQATVYPGSRVSSGGGVEVSKLFAHVLPFFNTAGFHPLFASNECEVAAVSTLLPLTLLCLVSYPSLIAELRASSVGWSVVGLALALMLAWMFLPIPAALGKALLWTYVPPNRMLWGFGLLLTLTTILLASRCRFELSRQRVWTFMSILFSGWLLSRLLFTLVWSETTMTTLQALLLGGFDGIAIVAFYITASLARKHKAEAIAINRLFVFCAAFTGMLTFGTFNPFQQAFPIFDKPRTPDVESARQEAMSAPNGWAVVPGAHGALFSGAGVRAINHTLTAPQLNFFRAIFPSMHETSFKHIFNRYAHIVPVLGLKEPKLLKDDVILVPVEAFHPKVVFHAEN